MLPTPPQPAAAAAGDAGGAAGGAAGAAFLRDNWETAGRNDYVRGRAGRRSSLYSI